MEGRCHQSGGLAPVDRVRRRRPAPGRGREDHPRRAEPTSNIFAKSICKDGGRGSYRGLLEIAKGAHGSKSKVVCDALLLDEHSRSDTYPTIRIGEDDVNVGHEATVSKVGDEQLFYLMSHGIPEDEASKLIVNGFVEPIIKQLPMEYAVEMNRLIELQMEGSIG
jgi:Fe-S cluster assembly protein SufB